MKRIIVEVDEAVAQNWEAASEAKKEEIAGLINKALNKTPEYKTLDVDSPEHKQNVKDYLSYLDKVGAKAGANGLTEEVLAKLLEEDGDDS